VGTLSGGLARRADLARALINDPRVLLLDEPTSGLDHASRMSFLDAIGELRSGDLTILMSTHLMDEAERADRVVMLNEGQVVADEAPSVLRRRHGGRVIRCWPKDAIERRRALSTLGESDLEPGGAQAGCIVKTLPEDQAAKAAAVAGELTGASIAFEIGPPTLADVYLSLTGRSLTEDKT
jgi:ABC-2 type transport system ATP-binding protein